MMEQLSMSDALFPRIERDPREECVKWLTEKRGCPQEVVPLVNRIFDEFPRWEAFDRAKAFADLFRNASGEADVMAERLGMFDHGIGYHQLWDRCWAMRQGLTLDEAARVIKWDYRRSVPVYMEVLA